MENKICRGGMIGAGAWSDIQLTAWSGVKNTQIVALTDRHHDRRDPIIEKWKIPLAFDDFEEMLDQAELDFVDICTRPYSHAQLIKLAADRGKNILCQKPFCQSLSEAKEVNDYCQKMGVRLMINENFRWQPWYRIFKEILDSGLVGEIFLARFHQRHRLTLPKFHHDQFYFREMPYLLIYEVGTHIIDVARVFFGEPNMVFTRLHKVSTEVVGEDAHVTILGYPHMTCIIQDSWASVPIPDDRPLESQRLYPRMVEVDGTRGTLVLQANGIINLYTDQGCQEWQTPQNSISLSHIACQQHFIDCLDSGKEFETSAEDTIKTMTLVYACYLSASEMRAVSSSEL